MEKIKALLAKLDGNKRIILVVVAILLLFVISFFSSRKQLEEGSIAPFIPITQIGTVEEDEGEVTSLGNIQFLWDAVSSGNMTKGALTKYVGEGEVITSNVANTTTYKHDISNIYEHAYSTVDQNGKVLYLRYPHGDAIPGDFVYFLEDLSLYGLDPDVELFYKYKMPDNRVYPYLEKGIAFEIIVDADLQGTITAFRFFEPTTKEDFLKKWGTDLTEELVTYGH